MHLAACYASFGASAHAASHLNAPGHRQNPLRRFGAGHAISEVRATLKGMSKASKFHIVGKNNKEQHVYERLFANGPRFAKNRVFPVELEQKGFTMLTVPYKNLLRASLHVAYTLLKRALRIRTKAVHFVVMDETRAQFDGESYRIKPGTKVTVRLSKRPFYVLSTLLRKEKKLS